MATCLSVWAANFAVTRYALLHGFEPLAYAAPRFAIAAAVFAGVALRRHRRPVLAPRTWGIVLVAGGALCLNQLAFVYAIRDTDAATTAMLFGAGPVLVVLFAQVVGVERGGRRYLGPAMTCAIGVAMVAAGAGVQLRGGLLGIALGLATAGTWATSVVAIAPLVRAHSVFHVTALVSVVGTVPLLFTSAPALVAQSWGSLHLTAWLALMYGAIVAGVVANLAWFTAIRVTGASRAALFTSLQPMLGVIGAVLLLSEAVTAYQLLGGALITAGIGMARPWQLPPQSTPGAPCLFIDQP